MTIHGWYPTGTENRRTHDPPWARITDVLTLIEAILAGPLLESCSGRVGLGSLSLGAEVGSGAAAEEKAADQGLEEGVENDLRATVPC